MEVMSEPRPRAYRAHGPGCHDAISDGIA
jgi:hypothetical protein